MTAMFLQPTQSPVMSAVINYHRLFSHESSGGMFVNPFLTGYIYIYVYIHRGFHSHGGIPKWLVSNGKTIYNWMMTGGTPISGNHHMCPESVGLGDG